MRIGIFPGTFDPIHFGHIQVLQAVADAYRLQRIIVVPAGCTPNKGLIDDSQKYQRWILLERSLSDLDNISCCSLEINKSTCSYTVETIKSIKEKYYQDELFLLLGEDLFASFHKWYQSETIMRIAHHIIVVKRDSLLNSETDLFSNDFELHLIEPVSSSSSTAVRTACLNAKPVYEHCPALCEFALYSFGLYLDDQISNEVAFLRKHQKPTRFKHTIGVVHSALYLSERLGIQNTYPVFKAALLHDIAKELPLEVSKDLAAYSSSDIGDTDIIPVIHAPAGAELSKRLFSVSDDIYNAIRLHCTLDYDMTLLDKIIYISDMVEPSRSYPAVYKLRSQFENVRTEDDLNKLLILALEQNICYISNTGGTVHPASIRALLTLKK